MGGRLKIILFMKTVSITSHERVKSFERAYIIDVGDYKSCMCIYSIEMGYMLTVGKAQPEE